MKKLIWSAVLLLAASTLLCHAADEPAFSCLKARSSVEKTICFDANLARLDRQLAHDFGYVLKQSTDPVLLRKSQRDWLQARDSCADVECITTAYEERIDVLARQDRSVASLQPEKLCRTFLDAGARSALLGDLGDSVDINNDGVVETARKCFGGTMNLPCTEYVDGTDVLPIDKVDFSWEDYWNFGERPFRYEDKTFIYASFDDAMREPAYISYVTPLNREVMLCDFDNAEDSVLLEGSENVCKAVASGDAAADTIQLTLTDTPSFSVFGRRETSSSAHGPVDIDNDGKMDEVIELNYSTGARRGCDYNYFDLASDKDIDGARGRVLDLQGVSADGRPIACFGQVYNRLFRFEGRTYFEANLANHVSLQRTVRLIDRGEVKEVCSFERRIRSTLKSMPGKDGGSGGARTHD